MLFRVMSCWLVLFLIALSSCARKNDMGAPSSLSRNPKQETKLQTKAIVQTTHQKPIGQLVTRTTKDGWLEYVPSVELGKDILVPHGQTSAEGVVLEFYASLIRRDERYRSLINPQDVKLQVQAVNGEQVFQTNHRAAADFDVDVLGLSSDGKLLAVRDEELKVRMFDIPTGKEILSFSGPKDADLHGIAMSPKGHLVAVVLGGRRVRLFNASTGKELEDERQETPSQATCVLFSPNGKTLASGGSRFVQFSKPGSGMKPETERVGRDFYMSLAFSPDGKQLACAGLDDIVTLWNIGERKVEWTAKVAHHNSVSISADGKWVAAAGNDNQVRLLDMKSGKELLQVPGCKPAIFSPDGKHLAARGAQGVAHPHSTVEAGEPGPRGPWGGKGDARQGPVLGTPSGGTVLRPWVNATITDSKADGEPLPGRTGCLNWARPDLWGPREATPGATRRKLCQSARKRALADTGSKNP